MLNPYPLRETDSYSFEFTTQNNVEYKIYFIDYSYMFEDYEHITCPIYTFNIEIISGNSLVLDDRIKITVLKVVELFFLSIDNVVIYVCESLDKRQYARKRKFDMWFNNSNNESIIKEDGIAKIEGVDILNSILIHKDNKQLEHLVKAFHELNVYDD